MIGHTWLWPILNLSGHVWTRKLLAWIITIAILWVCCKHWWCTGLIRKAKELIFETKIKFEFKNIGENSKILTPPRIMAQSHGRFKSAATFFSTRPNEFHAVSVSYCILVSNAFSVIAVTTSCKSPIKEAIWFFRKICQQLQQPSTYLENYSSICYPICHSLHYWQPTFRKFRKI